MQPLSSAVSHGKELYNTNSPSAGLVAIVRIIRECVPRVAVATIQGWGLVEEVRYHHNYGICRAFLLLQLLLSTKSLSSREVKARNTAFLFEQKYLNPLQYMI